MRTRRWRARLSAAAERDFASILEWTAERFGTRQARVYRDTLEAAVRALRNGPDVPDSRQRDDIYPGLYSLHVARNRRRGRHLLLYRTLNEDTIAVVRILHDSMDIGHHLPLRSDDN